MFCPQCSQAQTNQELKFCSRCGFPLRGVKELVANGGEPTSQLGRDGIRVRTVRRAVQGMVIIICSLLIGGILKVLGREYGFSSLPGELTLMIGFMIGALRLLTAMTLPLSRFSAKKVDQSSSTGPLSVEGERRAPMLPEAQTMPIGYDQVLDRRSTVAVPVPSVTEHTTRNLE